MQAMSFLQRMSLHSMLTELLSIMYTNSTSDLVSTLYIVLSLCQISGYIFKLNFTNISDSKMTFLLSGLFYSNFSNILFYFSYDMLTYGMFYFMLALLHFIVLFPVVSSILKTGLKLKVSNNPVYKVFNLCFRKLFQSFIWIMLAPALEFCMNITDCESYSYIPINRGNPYCVIPSYMWFLAAWCCALAFLISVLYMWTNTESSFLDTKSLKMNFTFWSFFVFLSRFVFIIIFPLIFNKSNNLVYVFLHINVCLAIIDYYFCFPIRNHSMNGKYIGFLCAMEVFYIIMTFWGVWNIIAEDNLFYVLVIGLLFGYKFGEKLRYFVYFRIMRSNFNFLSCKAYLLEELVYLFQKIKEDEKHGSFRGICRHHIRLCKEKKCRLMEKHLKRLDGSHIEEERLKIINDFILHSFQSTIEDIAKPGNTQNQDFLETYLMKYTSFLTTFNANPMKAFFEIQRIMKKHTHTSSLFRSFKSVLMKACKENILLRDKEKVLSNNNSAGISEKELEVNTFLDVLKEKEDFEKEALHVLKAKIAFWEKYKDGIAGYDEIIREIAQLTRKINQFRVKLDSLVQQSSSKSRPLFAYKLLSFLHCILLNDINEGLKYEEEVESTKKREFSHETNILTYLSFFRDNMIPLKVSFLSVQGSILESSKTPRLAEFFKYSKEDLKAIRLNDLMPKYISDYHDRFLLWHLNRPSKTNKSKFIDTYAETKPGFLIPINIYVGYAFEHKDDFVLHGLICEENSLETRNIKSMLFDNNGSIKGVNESFIKILTNNKIEISAKDIQSINIYNLIPNLFEIIDKNDGFKSNSSFIRNQSSMLQFPMNIMEIVDILRLKHKEEGDFQEKASYFSGMTSKTKKSSRNQTNRSLASESDRKKGNKAQFLHKLFTTKPDIDVNKRSEFEEKSMTHCLDDREIMKELINPSKCLKYRIYFDLKVHCYIYGDKPEQKLQLFCIKINRTRIIVGDNTISMRDTTKMTFSNDGNNKKEEIFPEFEQQTSEIESGFVHMPPENIASFRHCNRNAPESEGFGRLSLTPTPEPGNQINLVTETKPNNFLTTDDNLLAVESKEVLSLRIEHEVQERHQEKIEESLRESQEDEEEDDGKNMKSPEMENKIQTDRPNPKDIGKVSQKASSISTIKKAFSIFASIKNIQQSKPLIIHRLGVSLIFELIMTVIFCILVYTFTAQYLTNYYTPLEAALEEFAIMEAAWCNIAIVCTEMEFYKLNYTSIKPNSLEAQNMYEILNRSFTNTKMYLTEQRDTPTRFNYQTVFKDNMIRNTETTFYQTSYMNSLDVLDMMLADIMDIYSIPLDDQIVSNLRVFPLNFQFVVDVYDNTTASLTEEFLNSNSNTSNNILTVMLVFVILVIPLKLFQLREIISYYQRLMKLLNIFLRVNQKSAFNELFFQKEVLTEAFSKDGEGKDLLYVYFPERTINKKYLDLTALDESNSNSKAEQLNKRKMKKDALQVMKKNNNQKFSFHNLKPVSLLKPKIILSFSFLLTFSLFFFVYFDWTLVNGKINTLIQIHNYFYSFYSMPAHVLTLNTLMFREKLIYIPELQISNEPLQFKANREATILSELADHLHRFGLFATNFPTYLFEVNDAINSVELNTLITSNICVELDLEGYINSLEDDRCNILLNKAFAQGIISVMDQMLNTMLEQQIMVDLVNETAQIDAQLANIAAYVASEDNYNNVLAEHFYEETNLRIFYYLTQYYTTLIVNEITSLELMVLLFTIATGIIILLVLEYYRRSFLKLYREISMCLSLIPYERLINDEQTVFLIKKFGRV